MLKCLFLPIFLSFLQICFAYNPEQTTKNFTTKLTHFHYGFPPRKVPLKLYIPKKTKGVTIFLSHGLAGNREVGTYLATHWAGRGFVVIAMEHQGSNTAILKNVPAKKRLAVAKRAANLENYLLRTQDVVASVNQALRWNKEKKHALFQKIDAKKMGVGGHSFGALTSQAVTGQSYPWVGRKFRDKRLRAALLMSPGPPRHGSNKKAFRRVSVPWMLMTGTKDTTIITKTSVAQRKAVYKPLPKGGKYLLVLKNANHMAFSDRQLFGGKHKNKNHHRVIKALSSAFFEAHLDKNPKAKTWLDSNASQKILQKGDSLQKK